ncbi:MAG: NUDIX domain-containing protein, partial [Acidobacteria bacterium]|nr:NUDIX domain-containing protein [Acidobacteriota bacterium]
MTRGKNSTIRQAAAICYRPLVAQPEFLLVRTMDGLWTFPKGHIEPEQTALDAAEMEAYEEAGVFGVVDSEPLTTYQYTKSRNGEPRSAPIDVVAYLLLVRQTFPPRETYREPQWFAPEAACAALAEMRHPEDASEM